MEEEKEEYKLQDIVTGYIAGIGTGVIITVLVKWIFN